jgi:hypothetical protein
MNSRRISEALNVLTWLGDRAGDLPEEKSQALRMQVTLATTSLYLAEYLYHTLESSSEPYDALLKTVRGEMAWPELSELFRVDSRNPRWLDPDNS